MTSDLMDGWVDWIRSETDLLTSAKEAEKALVELVESRRTLAARHAKLETKLSAEDVTPTDAAALRSEMANIAADMDIRSQQVVELKQKIAAADLDNKAKTRWEYIQTMIEAKVRIFYLNAAMFSGSLRFMEHSPWMYTHERLDNKIERITEMDWLVTIIALKCLCKSV